MQGRLATSSLYYEQQSCLTPCTENACQDVTARRVNITHVKEHNVFSLWVVILWCKGIHWSERSMQTNDSYWFWWSWTSIQKIKYLVACLRTGPQMVVQSEVKHSVRNWANFHWFIDFKHKPTIFFYTILVWSRNAWLTEACLVNPIRHFPQ